MLAKAWSRSQLGLSAGADPKAAQAPLLRAGEQGQLCDREVLALVAHLSTLRSTWPAA